jgi:hypothetical protein
MRAGRRDGLSQAIGDLGESRPDDAWTLVLEAREEDTLETMRQFVRKAPEATLLRVEQHLRSLPDEVLRIEAVYVVEALRRRRRDVSTLAAVVDAPVLFVERVASGAPLTEAERPLLNRAGYAIEYNRVAWSERSARALERADATLDRAGIVVGGPDYGHVAKIVRAGLSDRWK